MVDLADVRVTDEEFFARHAHPHRHPRGRSSQLAVWVLVLTWVALFVMVGAAIVALYWR